MGAAHIAGDLIQPFVNPRGLAVAAALFIIGLPLCVRSSSSFSISPASYTTAKLSALHFLFRMSYSQVRGELLSCPSECRRVMRIQIRMPHSQVLDVMLYTVFRQRRPCTCSWDGGAFAQVGSTYGSNDVRGVCRAPVRSVSRSRQFTRVAWPLGVFACYPWWISVESRGTKDLLKHAITGRDAQRRLHERRTSRCLDVGLRCRSRRPCRPRSGWSAACVADAGAVSDRLWRGDARY